MPNVTISVPQELKTEMDKFPEVSWSEICRKAIARYINERKNPIPLIDLNVEEIGVTTRHDSGYPGISLNLKIFNRMDSEIVIDRMLYTARFDTRSGTKRAGTGEYLYKHPVAANSVTFAQPFLKILNDRIKDLDKSIQETFRCNFRFTIFVEGFKNPFNQQVSAKIPFDEWKRLVTESTTKNAG